MPLISNGTTEQLPAWVRQPMRTKQASEVPWRKNLKSTGGGTPAAPIKTATANAQKPPPAAAATAAPSTTAPPEQPKTTKLQINLKSVKKPDTPTQSSQSEKLPPVQLNPVLPENKATTNKPPTGKTIPITIQKTTEKPTPAGDTAKPPTAVTTTIPIQRVQNEAPTNKTTPIKTESKVKPKPVEATSKKSTKAASAATPAPVPEDTKMAPAPPPAPPAPPPLPGGPPPPPPPPGGPNAALPPKAPKSANAQARIDQLKKAPRKRPDWANMMKEIETARKLKHVQCNDRSKPILPKMKSRGKFVFESEAKPANKADALHNRLLNEIQSGIKLKKVQCNDRSKPQLGGLRFRRQSSVADSDVQKVSQAIPEQEELAFVMDIDVLRDELQSAKQMLEMEIAGKHNVEKKNRDQKCQIIAMEAEIETLKAKLGLIPEDEVSMLAKGLDKSDSKTFKHLRKSGSGLWKSPSIVGIKKSKSGITKELLAKPAQQQDNKNEQQEDDLNEVNELEEEISSLKQTVQHARKQAEEMEKKYKETMEKLLVAQGTLEDSEQKRRVLEKKVESLQGTQSGNKPATPIVQTAERTTQTEEQILERMMARQQSVREEGDGMFTDSEEEDSDVEVDEETVQRKKEEREVKLWENKLKSCKDKQHASRLERRNLKNLQKKLEEELKEAKKRHKKLQKEVDKMAKMLKEVEKADDDEEGDEEEEEKEEPATEEEEEESEEEESEEEESESDTEEEEEESSEEDDEEAGHEDRLALYGKRIKRRENVLNALRKGNYLLRANIDRLKDDLEEARITYHDLEHELSSVLDDM